MTLRSEIKKAINQNSLRYTARKIEEIEFEQSGYDEERRGYLTIVVAVKKRKRKPKKP